MSRPLAVGFALALVLLSALAPVGTAASSTSGEVKLSAQEFDRTEFTITVHANGSAEWTFTYKQTLANASERQQFREFAARFNSQETQLYTDFKNRARALVADGQRTTGREMNATGFSKEAYVNQLGNQGIVEMSFHWSGFAVVTGDRVVVGDVFEGGLYIGPSQRLVIGHGDDLVFSEVSSGPDATSGGTLAESDTVTWDGERSFSDNRPRVVLSTETATPTPTTGDGEPTPTPTPTPTTTDGSTGGGPGILPIVALLVVLLLGAVAAAYRTGVFGDDDDGSAAAAASGDGGDDPDGDTAPTISDEELMTDEDRVVSMLEERGGRMKQVNIVEETGWSKSKVSMLLSEMEEEGDISKLRVGRENIISLSGHEPDAARSPFDDEE
ncbi:helix-turn-helix transcriptional regulator [Natronomonas sp. EA1]|uniref:helix-turn-helix transcriptional regulator n=1 Tax=Natronomonas sp. EA1 TaxID=3421655 RepID=UPI003EBBFC2F